MSTLQLCLSLVTCVGLALCVVQVVAFARHLDERPRRPRTRPPISILKPLCGLDDELVANLESFLAIDYPEFEILLGVRDTRDRAWSVAKEFAVRWPSRVRLVVQRGHAGGNPKVNQLVTLSAAARHGILVVSDSNVRVAPDYLDEIAAHLEDPSVGLVYSGELVLNPIAMSLVAFAFVLSVRALALVAAALLLKVSCDLAAILLVDERWPGVASLAALPLKDLLLAAAWCHGLVHRSVIWRGSRIELGAGTCIRPVLADGRDAVRWFDQAA